LKELKKEIKEKEKQAEELKKATKPMFRKPRSSWKPVRNQLKVKSSESRAGFAQSQKVKLRKNRSRASNPRIDIRKEVANCQRRNC